MPRRTAHKNGANRESSTPEVSQEIARSTSTHNERGDNSRTMDVSQRRQSARRQVAFERSAHSGTGTTVPTASSGVTASSTAPTRKQGRPKGSKNKPKSPSCEVRQPQPKRRRTNQPVRCRELEVGTPSIAQPPASVVSRVLAAMDGEAARSVRSAAARVAIAAATSESPAPVIPPVSPPVAATPATPGSNRPPSIPSMYVNTLVAYSPAREGWATRTKYVGVGSAYIVGRVCRVVKRSLLQVNWLDSQFQNHEELLNVSMIQRGNANYRSLHGSSSGIGWGQLCAVGDGEDVQIDDEMDGLEECVELFNPPVELPTTLAEVEAIANMRFEPTGECTAPTDLYQHSDGTTKTRLRPEFLHLFQHSASASFFAYIPVSFWHQVVGEMNSYARTHEMTLRTPFTLDEVMTFLGVLLYMGLVKKGEYANYWGSQVEDAIFGGSSVGLDAVMPLRRFKQLRKAFCFQCVEMNTTVRDQAARIRPLLNLLKTTGAKYVEVGRNVALDEASVACRSKYGRSLIVYNPKKPTGKYHFRIYMLCCATTWISLNFRLHCESDIMDRLDGVTTSEDAQALSDEIAESSSVRQCVLEVARPVHGTRRIVNCDNYYTSVQLLMALRLKGLYARGTVRKSSAHFPRHVVLDKKQCCRGTSRQGVSADRQMVAASWYDSAVVTVISNADASTQTTVTRQVRANKRVYNAPSCIKEYNTNMQGVDRLDQIRARFSLADGHSFKKWHKKLACALIDVARANAYLTRKLAMEFSSERDPHREFIVQLISELLSGKWKEAPSERRMFFADVGDAREVAEDTSPSSAVWVTGQQNYDGVIGSPQKRCSAVASKQFFAMSRKRRMCVVCRWEERYATEVTDFCVLHNVCLCQNVFVSTKSYTCRQPTWTCWEKYHRYYLQHKLFSSKGKVRTSSDLYQAKMAAGREGNDGRTTTEGADQDDSGRCGARGARRAIIV